MRALQGEVLHALRDALADRPEVARALLVPGPEKPTLVLEYDERPPSVEDAQSRMQLLVAALRAPLGETIFEVAQLVQGAEVIYERRRSE